MTKPIQLVRKFALELMNMQRQRFSAIDYILINMPMSLPPIPDERNLIQRQILGEPPLSLLEFEQNLERIGDDPRPIGIILYLRGIALPLADLQTVRDAVLRLRDKGKRVIAYSARYDTSSYYLASAADEIILQPAGVLDVTGLLRQQVFMRDGLDAVGLQFDSVAISPYKGVYDTFTRMEPSKEGEEQMNRLLDSMYQILIDGIASTRKMKEAQVKKMIDGAPYLGEEAIKKGYIDTVLNEEALIDYLGITNITPWEEASSQLFFPVKDFGQKYVGVLYAGGLIMDGESASPPADIPIPVPFVGGERLGDITFNQQIRNIMQDEDCAAVVLYVDSGGGSATASEAMASALDELAKDRPLVVYMGGVAASGGYYIATPAQWIVAQSGTITGSIGVILGKLVNSELLHKLRFNAVEYMRGKNADLISSEKPFSDAQRKQMRAGIENAYDFFITRVANSRNMSKEQVDAIGGGRVWTGEQALENGLIDEIGGLRQAIKKARELAKLGDDAPSVLLREKGKALGVQLARRNPAAVMGYLVDNVQAMTNRAQYIMPFELHDK